MHEQDLEEYRFIYILIMYCRLSKGSLLGGLQDKPEGVHTWLLDGVEFNSVLPDQAQA